MNVKEGLSVAAVSIALMGIGYAAALRGQWIVDGAIAKAIAQEVAEQTLAPAEMERLEFQLEYKLNQLRPLQRIDKNERSEEDQDAIDDLKADIATLKKRLKKAKGQDDD